MTIHELRRRAAAGINAHRTTAVVDRVIHKPATVELDITVSQVHCPTPVAVRGTANEEAI